MSQTIKASELILNPDGSIYHLNLMPTQIASDIITVGDPDRVGTVAKHLHNIELDIQKREFRTITGSRNEKRWTIISTGIGTDNIDIVFNELDALANIDLKKRVLKEEHTTLNIYRIGTSGTLRKEIPVDSYLASAYGVGLGGLLSYYEEGEKHNVNLLSDAVNKTLRNFNIPMPAYSCAASAFLLNKLPDSFLTGITYTAPGFYGPQGRSLKLKAKSINYLEELSKIEYAGTLSTNLEMETAGIYGMSQMLGHQAISLNAILANRVTGEFSPDPSKAVNGLIKLFFEVFG